MFLVKLKMAAVAVALVASCGAALFAYSTRAGQAEGEKPPVEARKAPAGKEGPGPDTAPTKIRKLQFQLRDLLKTALKARELELLAGRATVTDMMALSEHLLQAELEVATTATQRVAAHAAHLKLAKVAEKLSEAGHEAGGITLVEHNLARAARLKAEIDWLRAGGKDGDDKGKKR
jgi:hypothetical protein